MSNKKILVLPGDGIGNEVMAEVLKIIDWLSKTRSMSFDISDSSKFGMSYNHISNASLGDKNPGANSYMFNFLKRF